MRGRKEQPNKFPGAYKQLVIDYIESYKPCTPHYRILHAPNKRYLPPDVTATNIFNNFIKRSNMGRINNTRNVYRCIFGPYLNHGNLFY